MKTITKMFLTGLLAGFFMTATAGPPSGGYPKQVPFMLFCHKDQSLMLKALSRSFGEYIFAEGAAADGTLFILHDPRDGSFSVAGTVGGETCVIFNGEKLKIFDEPPILPTPEEEDT